MSKEASNRSTYASAGVSIARGNRLLSHIQTLVEETHGPEVLGGLGGFGALFDLSATTYRQPVLVSGTDGVGTKLKLAVELDQHDTIGLDLVAMCVNDILVQGAEPLFFLDYFACSRLDVNTAAAVVSGMAQGCKLADCALVGGETAEMPGLYRSGEYDLAGFCVGVVEKARIITGAGVAEDDVLIALPSSGPHANGYSLIRKILSDSNTRLSDKLDDTMFADILLKPTRIYKKTLFSLLSAVRIKAIAHITGGGIIENLPRVIPQGLCVNIDTHSWRWPPIFQWLQQTGNVDTEEMYRTFNCGIGMVLIVNATDVEKTLNKLSEIGERGWVIGSVKGNRGNGKPVRLAHSP